MGDARADDTTCYLSITKKVFTRQIHSTRPPGGRARPRLRMASRLATTISKQSMEGKGPLSFEQILNDPVNLNYFKKFCTPLCPDVGVTVQAWRLTTNVDEFCWVPRAAAYLRPHIQVHPRSKQTFHSGSSCYQGFSSPATFLAPRHGGTLDREPALLAGGVRPPSACSPTFPHDSGSDTSRATPG